MAGEWYDVSGYLSSGSVNQIVLTTVWTVIIFGVIVLIGMFIRDRVKYRYRGEVYKRRQFNWATGMPESEKIEGSAGYFRQRELPIFKIRYGFMPWQRVVIKKLPDPRYMQNRTATFLQYNIGELVQAKKEIDWDTGTIKIQPIDSTTKAAAKAEMNQYSSILSVKSKLMENIAIISMGFILIAGIVAFYFVSRACGS